MDSTAPEAAAPAARLETRAEGDSLARLQAASWPRWARPVLLVTVDALSLFTAGALAYLSWARPFHHQPASLYLGLLPMLAAFLFAYAQAGLYPGFGLGPVETLRRQVLLTLFGFLALAALSFAIKLPPTYSRITFGLGFLFSLALLPLVRTLALKGLRRLSWWPEPVVLVGGTAAERLRELAGDAQLLDYRPVGLLTTGDASTGDDESDLPRLGNLETAPEIARRGVRVALLTASPTGNVAPLLDELQQHFRHVVALREYEDLPVEGARIRNLGRVLGVEYTNNLLQPHNRALKRCLDLSLASVGLLVAAPIIAVAALAIRLTSPGSPFFAQHREGLDGRTIRVWKLRTMYADAEERLKRHLEENPELRREWETRYKLARDPRLLPGLGRFLRRFSIDELPQLWNVARGQMSLVGPRPFPEYHLARFSAHFRQVRRRVRPGITGLWQVTVRSEGGIEEQQTYDAFYIRNWSLWLDLYILSKTAAAVLGGRGAY